MAMLLWTPAAILAVAGLGNDLRGQSSHFAYQVLAGYILLVAALQLPCTSPQVEGSSMTKVKTVAMPFSTILFRWFTCTYYALIDMFLPPSLRNLPSPSDNIPLLGQAKNQFTADNPAGLYMSLSRQFPSSPFIRVRFFFDKNVLLVNSLEAAKQVLFQECYSFKKPAWFFRGVSEIAGVGLLFSEFEEHRIQRKRLQTCFSPPNLKKLLPVFRKKATELGDYVDKLLGPDGKESLEISSLFTRATLAVIGLTALGADLGKVETTTRFQELYEAVFSPPGIGKLLTFINIWIPLRWLPVKANNDFKSAMCELKNLLRKAIRRRKTELEGSKKDLLMTKDILGYMLEQDGADIAWTEDDILGHMLNIVGAGHETTASTLTWSCYELAKRPEIQQELRQEIESALETEIGTSYADIDRLPHLDNFVKEVLRLYPSVPSHPREAAKDVNISGTIIPKGGSLVICPSVINRLPDVWGDDAEQFRPGRWFGMDAPSQLALMTFFQGPRQCIGKGFAMLEIKSILCEMISRFQFECSEDVPRFENPSILLRPEGGLRVVLSRLS